VASASTAIDSLGRFTSSALMVSVLAGGLCAVVAALIDQTRGLGSALGAVALVLAYFFSGQLVERIAMQLANSQGMVLIMSGYLVRVLLLGLILRWALSSPAVASLVSPVWVCAGALAAVVGWLGGLIVRHSRARIAVYDRPYQAPAGWDE